MHVFEGRALLVQLRLQYGIVHQIDACHAAHHHVSWLVRRVISLVVSYAYHLLRLIGSRARDDGRVYDCVQVAAVVIHCTVAACSHASVLVESIGFIQGCLRARRHASVWAILNLTYSHVSNTWVHHLGLRHLHVALVHILLDVLFIGSSSILWAVGSTRRPLPPHVHLLVFGWSRSLRHHGTVRDTRVYHGYLTIMRGVLWLLLADEVLL